MTNYKIDIVSDTVCPWCFIGWRRLQLAIHQHKTANPGDTFSATWHAYQLNPDAPKSIDKQEYYHKRFGAARSKTMYQHVEKIGEQLGIDFNFGGKTGNTRNSHRLVELGRTKGEEVQTKVMEQLFHAYFEANDDITDVDTLIAHGIRAGLPADEVKDWMLSDKGGPEVDAEVGSAQRKFISGVPNYTINGRYEVQGAEAPSEFLHVFEEIKSAEAQRQPLGGRIAVAEAKC